MAILKGFSTKGKTGSDIMRALKNGGAEIVLPLTTSELKCSTTIPKGTKFKDKEGKEISVRKASI